MLDPFIGQLTQITWDQSLQTAYNTHVTEVKGQIKDFLEVDCISDTKSWFIFEEKLTQWNQIFWSHFEALKEKQERLNRKLQKTVKAYTKAQKALQPSSSSSSSYSSSSFDDQNLILTQLGQDVVGVLGIMPFQDNLVKVSLLKKGDEGASVASALLTQDTADKIRHIEKKRAAIEKELTFFTKIAKRFEDMYEYLKKDGKIS